MTLFLLTLTEALIQGLTAYAAVNYLLDTRRYKAAVILVISSQRQPSPP